MCMFLTHVPVVSKASHFHKDETSNLGTMGRAIFLCLLRKKHIVVVPEEDVELLMSELEVSGHQGVIWVATLKVFHILFMCWPCSLPGKEFGNHWWVTKTRIFSMQIPPVMVLDWTGLLWSFVCDVFVDWRNGFISDNYCCEVPSASTWLLLAFFASIAQLQWISIIANFVLMWCGRPEQLDGMPKNHADGAHHVTEMGFQRLMMCRWMVQ